LNRAQFQKLAEIRAAEASRLFEGRMYDGAYYLAGYAVECGFKACIAKLVKRHDFPEKDFVKESYTHNFEILVKSARLGDALSSDRVRDSRLATNWTIVREWKEDSRYERWSRTEALSLLTAITEDAHGVLPWIKRYW
jgi:HEPN domain-containing protein